MDDLTNDLTRLTRRLRTAFAAACAQRVLVIHDIMAQSGASRSGAALAVDTAWQFAEGAQIDKHQLARVKAELDRAFPEPDLGGGSDHAAVAAAAYALDAIDDDDPDSAEMAAARACEAIRMLDSDEGAEEESEWQLGVLQSLKDWRAEAIDRDLFSSTIAAKPAWLKRIE